MTEITVLHDDRSYFKCRSDNNLQYGIQAQVNFYGFMITEVEKIHFSAAPVGQLYAQLKCSEKGLAAGEAAERLRQQHKLFRNETRFKREAKLLLRQFMNPPYCFS